MTDITYIIPYYRAPVMLRMHLEQWRDYSPSVRDRMDLLIVDDGSPEPAEPVVREVLHGDPSLRVQLLRIHEDIPWNRNGARNLGANLANTPWLLHTDIDHLLTSAEAAALVRCTLNPAQWYRFRRFRIGRADETRRKDAIADALEYGEIKPHGDSYLCTRERYWACGGYDEDYSGHLGGGTPFLNLMSRKGQPVVLDVALQVYTRHAVSDASVSTLPRDASHYAKLRAQKKGAPGKNPLRFKWAQIL